MSIPGSPAPGKDYATLSASPLPLITRLPVSSSPTPSPGTIPGPFATLCEACHPQGGMVPGIGPSLRGVTERHSPDFIRQQLQNGRGDMPGFQDRLSAEDLEQLLAYLRTLSGPPAFNRTPSPPDPAAAARGQALFRERCESCHLDGGRQPGIGLGFEPPAPALVNEVRRHTSAFIARQIREGGGQMSAIGADLADAQVADLLAYLSALTSREGP